MKLTALLLLFAIIGKMSAVPVRYPVRLAYYRSAPAQIQQDEPMNDEAEDDDDEADVSDEVNFSATPIQDDDDEDSEEQEEPPQFQKLFPLPQQNSPGHNMPLSIMMGEISAQGWKVPKHPQGQQQREARDAISISRDDDDDDSDEDDDEDEEEDEESEDDLPEWNTLFPNLEAEANAGPPSDLVDTSTQPEIPASFRSGLGGSRVVYVPASAGRQFRQYGRRPVQQISRPQYVMRNPSPPRSQVVYMASPNYMNRRQQQPIIQRRPQQQVIYAAQQPIRRQQQPYVMYMPVRRNSYSPYVSPYVPRYRN